MGVIGYKYTITTFKLSQKKQDNSQDGNFDPKTSAKSDLNMFASGTSTSSKTVTSNVKELLIDFKKQPNIVFYNHASLNIFSAIIELILVLES